MAGPPETTDAWRAQFNRRCDRFEVKLSRQFFWLMALAVLSLAGALLYLVAVVRVAAAM